MPISYLCDTNTLSLLARDDDTAWANLASVAADDRIFTCFIVIGEWEYGIRNAKTLAQRNQIRASGDIILKDFDGNWESSSEIDLEYGVICAELRVTGKMIPSNDAWIAAVARTNAATLVTSDPHFKRVPGLQTVDWAVAPLPAP